MKDKTASILVIGNEILSGKVQDRNIRFIANRLSSIGIELKEVRIVKDIELDIIEAVNSLRSRFDYVFTSGGIGPTHDDITSMSIAKAFGTKLIRNQTIYEMIKSYYASKNQSLNDAREKMAYIPYGSYLIDNDISKAPGFLLDNVFVLAGIPEIMENMFEYVEKHLEISNPITTKSIKVFIGESEIAKLVEESQHRHHEIEIGSYPFSDKEEGTEIVFRGKNTKNIESAMEEINKKLDEINLKYEIQIV